MSRIRILSRLSDNALSQPILLMGVASLFTFLAIGIVLSGCNGNANFTVNSSTTTISPTPSPSTTVTGGARAVKILFKATSGGSFNAAPAGGTAAAVGSGLQAQRVFNPDGSLLASGTASSTWPAWLSSFEIGISGTSNSSAKDPNCAKFASSTEATDLSCDFGNGSGTSPCGAPPSQFRVSEVDCSLGSPAASNGNGGPSDGVYLRAKFNRSQLGSSENILVVMEYSASALNPAPSNPTTCFQGGAFTPEACSDFVWKAYLKHSSSELVQPYLLLVPPTFASVLVTVAPTPLAGAQGSGTGIAAKQFFLPLAADSNLTELQITRRQSNFPSPTNLKAFCTPTGTIPGNSPLCAGMVFYSLTFYRM